MTDLDQVASHSNVMGGRATVRGIRVTGSLVVSMVANGMSTEETIETYPYLEPEDIR